ncbi:MAG: hypothetical protein ABS944_12735 [Solibacillus sp.]|uniref:hypothetical protein n=1 Tax=Solibacillus sp. TaxID=1909654 RepID=UPI003314B3F5
MKNRRTIFLIFGFIMLFNAIFINGAYIVSGKFPEGLLAFAFTIMTFCLAYLAPHLAEKDERAQRIRERAIYSSYFWGMGFAVMLMILFNPTSTLNLATFHVLSLFVAFYISTVFLNMVYYAKKY